MRIPLPGRKRGDSGGTGAKPAAATADAPAIKRKKPSRKVRLLRTLLLFGLFAAFTSPGRRFVRATARELDRHSDRFTEPESLTYAHVIAPLLGRLYKRAADDVALELRGFPKGQRPTIVDIGCGTGELAVAISKKARQSRIVGVDVSPSMLLWASRHETTDGRIRFMVGDGAKLPFPDESVDVVVSTLSLHHWAEPAAVLAEIDRVLTPDGRALIYDLGLLTLTLKEMESVAEQAKLPPESIDVERVRGGLLSRLFVVFRFERDV